MAVSNFSLVNQKLAFAKSLCDLARGVATPATSAERLRQDAVLSSGVYQLSLAFHFYLREIADRCFLKNSGAINSLAELQLALAQNDKFLSEVSELDELAARSGSWLEQLQRYAQSALESPRKEKERKSFQQDNLIIAVEITAEEEVQAVCLTVELLESWQDSFRALVLRQRDTSAEF